MISTNNREKWDVCPIVCTVPDVKCKPPSPTFLVNLKHEVKDKDEMMVCARPFVLVFPMHYSDGVQTSPLSSIA